MLDATLAMIAATAARGDKRHIAICLSYAALRITFDAAAPSAVNAGAWWYAMCSVSEISIIIACLIVATSASSAVATFGCMALSVHILTGIEFILYPDSYLFYDNYPWMIQYFEAGQVFALFFFSPKGLQLGRRFASHRHDRKEPPICRQVISNSG